MDGGAWWTTVHGVAELDMTERLHFLFFLSLDIREIKVVNPKGNQPKLFIFLKFTLFLKFFIFFIFYIVVDFVIH